jgi:hypothetical protein
LNAASARTYGVELQADSSVCGPQLISDQGATVLNPRTVAIQLKYMY